MLYLNSKADPVTGILKYKCKTSYSVPSISGIARCFTFGGSRKRMLHNPAIPPRSDLSKEQYMNKEEQTTINHFHEKLLKLKDMMKTKVQLFYYFCRPYQFYSRNTQVCCFHLRKFICCMLKLQKHV